MRKFPSDIESKFKIFLRNNWVGNTHEDLASAWNIQSHRHPTDAEGVKTMLRGMGIGVIDSEADRICDLKKRESEIISSNTPFVFEKIKAERIKLMRWRVEGRRDIWTGLDSEEAAVASEKGFRER